MRMHLCLLKTKMHTSYLYTGHLDQLSPTNNSKDTDILIINENITSGNKELSDILINITENKMTLQELVESGTQEDIRDAWNTKNMLIGLYPLYVGLAEIAYLDLNDEYSDMFFQTIEEKRMFLHFVLLSEGIL